VQVINCRLLGNLMKITMNEDFNNYTYPQIIIDERTGRIEVFVIEHESGQVVRRIQTNELSRIVHDYVTQARFASSGAMGA
jgi:hypothetical protein